MMDSLVLCVISENFDITKHFNIVEDFMLAEDDYTESEIDNVKNEIKKIVSQLKSSGFYSGDEMEYPTLVLHEVFDKLGLISKTIDKTGHGIDFLNSIMYDV
jgi:hypothetical protein